MTEPLVIIGAGRSGTNALRDALTRIDRFHTWPCDEINYIWRFGNRDQPDDEFDRPDATTRASDYIRAAFHRQGMKHPDRVLVEKTCANSLRVGFVDEVMPNARFVHIIRDGRDVTSSAMSRWTASLDVPYVIRKARFVPMADIPFYARRYLQSHLERHRSRSGALPTWGPRFVGMEALVQAGAELDVICATQWAACVRRSVSAFSEIAPERIHTVTYDDFTADPVSGLLAIAQFAGVDVSPAAIEQAASGVHVQSAGAWRERLAPDAVERITPIVAPVHDLVGLPG